jgi:hypothetical protein
MDPTPNDTTTGRSDFCRPPYQIRSHVPYEGPFAEITAQTEVVLWPWLQAFAWHTKTYSDAYIRTQVGVAGEQGRGVLFWNARNDYSKLFPAMAEMRAAPGRLFRGDEIGASQRKLSASPTLSNAPGAQ